MPPLNVVALISGGKDSFFSILHVQANGHKVVALANLHPPLVDDDSVEDLESYMYQTIGHAVIPLYEQALGLPVYRQVIRGGAVNRDKSYGPSHSEDETESLLPLLRKVIAAHPQVNAVSTGAILSDYQRTRVESVALRLDLTPLSYLWQWPFLPPGTQTSLLEDMAAAGQDSRIIKVASGGLDDSFLWQNVADARTIHRLSRAAERFGTAGDGAVLGEGGEYETLAVSGPAPLWKGRIDISSDSVQTVFGEAGSASVKMLQPKVVMTEVGDVSLPNLRTPPLLDPPFQRMFDQLLSTDLPEPDASEDLLASIIPFSPPVEASESHLQLSNLAGSGANASSQTKSIMAQISGALTKAGHTFSHIAYTIIILRDMNDFAAVNAVYGSYFVDPNPPARLTIAWADGLPTDALLSISITSVSKPAQGLHVQSRSYWAPANIGPYSQAIAFPNDSDILESVRGSVYIAGQIPLTPASMELPMTGFSDEKGSFTLQSVLALQHLARIGKVMKVRHWTCGIVFLAKTTDDGLPLTIREDIVRRSWKAFHLPPATGDTETPEEDDDFDVWHATHGASSTPWRVTESDDTDRVAHPSEVPPLLVIDVDALPRGSEVEWIGYGKTTDGNESSYPLHLQSILDIIQKRSKDLNAEGT